MKRELLIQDLEYCENAMTRLGDRSDIWQDRMVYMAFKILRDILMELRHPGMIEMPRTAWSKAEEEENRAKMEQFKESWKIYEQQGYPKPGKIVISEDIKAFAKKISAAYREQVNGLYNKGLEEEKEK